MMKVVGALRRGTPKRWWVFSKRLRTVDIAFSQQKRRSPVGRGSKVRRTSRSVVAPATTVVVALHRKAGVSARWNKAWRSTRIVANARVVVAVVVDGVARAVVVVVAAAVIGGIIHVHVAAWTRKARRSLGWIRSGTPWIVVSRVSADPSSSVYHISGVSGWVALFEVCVAMMEWWWWPVVIGAVVGIHTGKGVASGTMVLHDKLVGAMVHRRSTWRGRRCFEAIRSSSSYTTTVPAAVAVKARTRRRRGMVRTVLPSTPSSTASTTPTTPSTASSTHPSTSTSKTMITIVVAQRLVH